MLSQKAIEEFKEIYVEEYKAVLSNQEAQEKAEKLLLLIKAVYRQIPLQEAKYDEQNK